MSVPGSHPPNTPEVTLTMDRLRDLYSWAYAWRTADEPDETDMSSMRDAQRAEFDRALAAHDATVRAATWDEGWEAGNFYAIDDFNRDGKDTNPYAPNRELDPEPWVFGLFGNATASYTPARSAVQETGSFIFIPRPEFEQDTSKYEVQS